MCVVLRLSSRAGQPALLGGSMSFVSSWIELSKSEMGLVSFFQAAEGCHWYLPPWCQALVRSLSDFGLGTPAL